MILLLGASGYIGRTFASELRRRGHCFIPLTRGAFDYTRFDFLFDYLRTMRPVFLINAASYECALGSQVADAERERMMAANAILPQMIARVCMMTKVPWGHVSSGSIYDGAKLMAKGELLIQHFSGDDGAPGLYEAHPELFHGFNEMDEPNFSFHSPSCSFYSGTKALAEEAIRDIGQSYIWRLRLPFNEREEPCNWLWQMRHQEEVRDGVNSFSHLEDSVRACLDLWETRATFGIYNVTNPGALTTGQIVQKMRRVLRAPVRLGEAGMAHPQPDCILDSGKLLGAGVKLRSVEEALDDCLDRMRVSAKPVSRFEGTPRIYSAAM
jgi:dTDP-4-dehydrorhamnose reductase